MALDILSILKTLPASWNSAINISVVEGGTQLRRKQALKKNEKTKQNTIFPNKEYASGPEPVHVESETFHFFL